MWKYCDRSDSQRIPWISTDMCCTLLHICFQILLGMSAKPSQRYSFDMFRHCTTFGSCSLSNILVISIDLRSVYEPGNVLCSVWICHSSGIHRIQPPPSREISFHTFHQLLNRWNRFGMVWVWNKTCFQVEVCWNVQEYFKLKVVAVPRLQANQCTIHMWLLMSFRESSPLAPGRQHVP